MKWTQRALADCASFSSGGTPNKGRPEYWGGAIPWVSSGEMTSQFIKETTLQITEEGLSAGSRLMPEGTIFAVVRGMSLATEFRVSYATVPMAFNQDLKALVAKEGIDPYFLFSTLRSQASAIRDLATEAAHGTKKLEMERFQSFKILVPDFDTQIQVSKVIRNYDDLIQNNQRRIVLLEESARLMYREWFVNLRYPGGQQRFGSIPAGWEVKPMTEMAIVNRASLNSKDKPEAIQYIDIASVETGVVASTTKMQYADAPGRARRLVQHGDVIWSCVRPNRRSYAMIWNPDGDIVVSTGFAVLTAKTVPFTYLYLVCTSDEFVAYLTSRATGAAYPAVSGKDFEEAQLLCPDQDLLSDFHERCLPLFELRNDLIRENRWLEEARNALLPKLMSGEIQV